jgi:hypothetical protein
MDLIGGASDQRGQAFEDLEIELEGFASSGRLGALARASFESLLYLCSTLFQESSTFSELRLSS